MTRLALLLSLCAGLIGCSSGQEDYTLRLANSGGLAHGLVVILPGIEGESPFNHEIRRGLQAAGLDQAMPIYAWGRPIPIAGPLINQVDVLGNREQARRIAKLIMDYQDQFPDRPVYLVGHSGGGGLAVFAAEALPQNRQVEALVLLSASISSEYDLTKALLHSRRGVVNFHSAVDVGLLMVGTTLAGNVDGVHGPSAGAVGFHKPTSHADSETRVAYRHLYEVKIGDANLLDAHTAATNAQYVRDHVAPWLQSVTWPAQASVRPTSENDYPSAAAVK